MGDEFPMFGNEDITDEAVGGGFISGASRLGNKYSTPIENGAKLFMQGRSGSELNKVVNHAAKKQWSWAPSSKPNPKTDWGARRLHNNHARRAILMRQKFNQMNSNFFAPRI